VGRDRGEVAILKAYVIEEGEAERQPVMPDPRCWMRLGNWPALGCSGSWSMGLPPKVAA
jgi:hypothetical protein